MTLTTSRTTPLGAVLDRPAAALTLDRVTVRHPDGVAEDGTPRHLLALDQVSLAADPGTVTAVVGPSGSGKSTLLGVVAGLVVPDEGTVTVGGTRLDGLGEDGRTRLRRDRVGIVFQQPNLLASLTAVEQLTVAAHLAGDRGAELRGHASAPGCCSTGWAWAAKGTVARTSCPAGSGSGSTSPAP